MLRSLLVSDFPDKYLFRRAPGLVDNMTEDGDPRGWGGEWRGEYTGAASADMMSGMMEELEQKDVVWGRKCE